MLESVEDCKSSFFLNGHISNVSICLWRDKLLRPLLALLLTLFNFYVIREIINNLVLINILVLVRRAISAAATAIATTSLLQLFLRLLLNISKHVLVVVEPLILYGMLELLRAGSIGGTGFKGLTNYFEPEEESKIVGDTSIIVLGSIRYFHNEAEDLTVAVIVVSL